MNALKGIAEKLKTAMGLDMATVGSSLIERVVHERMAALNLDKDETYLAQLHIDPAELQNLIELAVVPETWFFRDREAMLAVARLGREKLVSAQVARLRILSLPCSTGEEPYSVAMALFDQGVPASAFRIDAIDIRTRSLEIAAAGLYGRNSFRGRELGFRDRYFTQQDTEWRIADEVKAQVAFVPGNLLAADFMRNEQPYDFILCRNVLIYFDREVQQQVVAILDSLLKDDGHIFVGPAEGGIMLNSRVAPAGIPLAFGFRKRCADEPAFLPVSKTMPVRVAALLPVQAKPRPFAAKARPSVPQPEAVPATGLAQADLLVQARHLADQGEFARANALCEKAVQEHGPSAEAFYLHGLISDAGGDVAGAQRCYRKAIYLAPDHHEALLHLAALLQAQGDAAGASRMRERAQRVEQSVMKTGGLAHG
ncbi:CheR family methyltransferase [Herbaspirillum chlorophenolicum]|uniref:CheR family methyltransferase n=1 Tax=Herbaspirillum chlorophenolicum TaxID=211589 RepID=UPI00067D3757|nr:protein-glutamate O-methyltransferase CheR [Herbaspirillum chlorophenolicum]